MDFRSISLDEVSHFLGIGYHGQNVTLDGLTKIVSSRLLAKSAITFCNNPNYLPTILGHPGIGAIIVADPRSEERNPAYAGIAYLISTDPAETFYRLHQHLWDARAFYRKPPVKTIIGEGCTIHPTAFVEEGVLIGNNVRIGAMCVIHENTIIASDSSIDSHTVIGSNGFEIKNLNGRAQVVSHAGGVCIAENVDIGVGCVVDRSLFEGHTTIGANSKIDNHVQIAHDCRIGENSIICAKSQISGNVVIGENCYIAPGAILRDQLEIAGAVILGMGSVVTRSIDISGTYFGSPAKLRS